MSWKNTSVSGKLGVTELEVKTDARRYGLGKWLYCAGAARARRVDPALDKPVREETVG